MNIKNLQQIINNYLIRFEELNNPINEEYYKWQIAYQFKPMMDKALEAPIEEFSAKLLDVKKLTYNLIDSYTQPFYGLVRFSEEEPNTVREMFKILFQAAEADVKGKQAAIDSFLDMSHQLRDNYSAGSYLYNDDYHSVSAYLFLYDPEHNYLYKASHCRAFADCIEFYDDWGYGADTKLDVFFRMCDEVLSLIRKDDNLMAAASGRFDIDPNGMHPDKEKHILLFDLIYCCTTYGLFPESFASPKSGERKILKERKEKAQELALALAEAQEQLDLLNDAKAWIKESVSPAMTVQHKTLGKGSIQQIDDNYMTIQFSNGEQKKFLTSTCLGNGLISFENGDIQSNLQNYKGVLRKDQKIRDSVRWAENALAPYSQYLD